MTFSSDSGNATLTVESGSTGNKTIDRVGTINPATITLASSLDVIHNGSGLLTLGNAVNASVTGAGDINKFGTGTLVLAGANSYTGMTTINEGVLQVTNGAAIANTNAVSLSNNAGATFLVSTSETIGSLRGGGGAGGNVSIESGSTLTVSETGSQTFSGVISNAGSLTKSGNGTLTLSGANSYSGATTVSAGTLAVDGTNSASATTVQSGATLGGSGSLSSVTIEDGGTISPGNSPGTITMTNGLTWNAGGNYNWQIFDAAGTAGSANGWDLIAVTGGTWDITGLNSGNPFEINLWSLSGISPDANGDAINFDNTQNYTWEILAYTSLNGTFSTDLFNINVAANNGTGGYANALGGGVFSLAVDGDSLNLLFTAAGAAPVPEPGTWAAAALLAVAIFWRRFLRGRGGMGPRSTARNNTPPAVSQIVTT